MTWFVRNVLPVVLVSIAALLMFCTGPLMTSAYAFDGKWPGFLMASSVGAGGTSAVGGNGYDRETSFAGSTGLRFGYGVGSYAVFFMTHTTWSNYEGKGPNPDYHYGEVPGHHGFHGVVVAYQTRPRWPFLYPLAGFGITNWGEFPLHPESNVRSAFGFLAGAGIQTWKHVSLELFGYKGVGANEDYVATRAWSIQLALTFTAS